MEPLSKFLSLFCYCLQRLLFGHMGLIYVLRKNMKRGPQWRGQTAGEDEDGLGVQTPPLDPGTYRTFSQGSSALALLPNYVLFLRE